MSENEEKAIKILKDTRQAWARIVYRYILKQQKEIETLKAIINKGHEYNLDKRYVELKYINKDKIREKIKKEEKYQETIKKLFPDSFNYHIQEYAIEVLKELLEE